MGYRKIPQAKAYRLINTGALVLVTTVSGQKEHDIATIAWTCPAELAPARVLLCIDAGHATFANLKQTGKFCVGIPHASQVKLVEQAGSVSGRETDKFEKFGIKYITGKKTGCRVPTGMIGYLECRVKDINDIEGTAIVVGDVLFAAADPKAFSGGRLLAEKAAGKAIHHLGGRNFITYGDRLL